MTEKQAEFIPEDEDIDKFNGRAGAEVPAVIQQDGFFAIIERMSNRPDFSVDMIKQLQEIQEHSLDRNAKQEFNAAMTRVQGKIELVVAKEKNTQTKSNYANLKAVLIKSKPIYTGEGFSLMFYEGDSPKETQKRVCVDIMHSGGHTEKRHGDFTIQTTGIAGSAMMTQIHGEGSAFSYGRRYLTCMVFNIPTGDDDDGNAAGSGEQKFITPEQVSELTKELNKFPDKGVAFLKFVGVETVDTIYAGAQYKKALQTLKSIKAKSSKREPGSDDN